MAIKYSDDKFSGVTGGDIYYITAGLLPYEFEDPMYTLKPGEVYGDVAKTRFGYHLIKVTERQHRFPKIKRATFSLDINAEVLLILLPQNKAFLF
jgi:parvulin-like peptidyl-prolyl isomerase